MIAKAKVMQNRDDDRNGGCGQHARTEGDHRQGNTHIAGIDDRRR